MNRQILFRGKRVDDGKWVFGDLEHNGKNVPKWVNGNEIVPESVGQFTGLTDKNGNKIFEGDILRGFAYPFRNGEGKHNYYAEVVWFKNSPAFGLVIHKNPKSNVVGISEGNCEYMEDWVTFLWEVIGNIYDNPELLGEQK